MERVISYDKAFFDYFFQGISVISIVAWLVITILLIRLIYLGIKALKIYIKKNS